MKLRLFLPTCGIPTKFIETKLKISLLRNTHIFKEILQSRSSNQSRKSSLYNQSLQFFILSSVTLINSIKIIKLNRLPVSHISLDQQENFVVHCGNSIACGCHGPDQSPMAYPSKDICECSLHVMQYLLGVTFKLKEFVTDKDFSFVIFIARISIFSFSSHQIKKGLGFDAN